MNASNSLHLGSRNFDGNSLYGFNGYLDEIRISKGVARWSSNFTQPNAPYTNKITIDSPKVKPGTRVNIGGTFYKINTVTGDGDLAGQVLLSGNVATGAVSQIYGTEIISSQLALSSALNGTILPIKVPYTTITSVDQLNSSSWSSVI